MVTMTHSQNIFIVYENVFINIVLHVILILLFFWGINTMYTAW